MTQRRGDAEKSNPMKINVAIVGLGFGAEFIPIYQNHPNTNMYAICQRTRQKLDQIGDQYKIGTRYQSFEDLIAHPRSVIPHLCRFCGLPDDVYAMQRVARGFNRDRAFAFQRDSQPQAFAE